jgi:hypothetical protein
MAMDDRGQNRLVISDVAEGAKQHGSPKILMLVVLAEYEPARRTRPHIEKIDRL